MTHRKYLLIGITCLFISQFEYTGKTFAGKTLPFLCGLTGLILFSKGCYESGKGSYRDQCELEPGMFYDVLGKAIHEPRLTILERRDTDGQDERLWLLDNEVPPGVTAIKAVRGKTGIEVKIAFRDEDTEGGTGDIQAKE